MITFECHQTNILKHSITLNVIEPAAANVADAGSITFDHILMTFYHIFDNNVRKRFPDKRALKIPGGPANVNKDGGLEL